MDENGYPQYRRKDNKITYELQNGYVVDNRWVVPYCPILLQIFNCHMNVDVVSTILSVKYLYKYVYKGHDAATVTIGESNNENFVNHDEINNFIETRYVGPAEACYRILSKPLQDKSHAIIRLPVHLPNQQSIIISNNLTDIAENLNQSSSMLMDYFELNLKDEEARKYFYKDIPCHYVYKKEKIDGITVSKWDTRKKHVHCVTSCHLARFIKE